MIVGPTGGFMMSVRILAVASLAITLGGQPLTAQSLSRYRTYALESSVASIVKTSGAAEGDLKTLHERPARIQQLEWRAPYVPTERVVADPVRTVVFSFYDDQLYQVVVTYERDRMEGLTNADLIEAIGAAYGTLPLHTTSAASPPLDIPADSEVVARWDGGASVLSLVRGAYSREFQLVLISKQLSQQARSAIKEALRLDVQQAPQREVDRRTKELADARISDEKARAKNKAAFRP
jgi:hypothetical protein